MSGSTARRRMQVTSGVRVSSSLLIRRFTLEQAQSLRRLRSCPAPLLCLAGFLILLFSAYVHVQDHLVQLDSACTLCHAGESTLANPPAPDAGKPNQLTPAELVVPLQADPAVATVREVESSRAPPAISLA